MNIKTGGHNIGKMHALSTKKKQDGYVYITKAPPVRYGLPNLYHGAADRPDVSGWYNFTLNKNKFNKEHQ